MLTTTAKDFADQLDSATTMEEAWALFQKQIKAFGDFDLHYGYSGIPDIDSLHDVTQFYSSLDQRYIEQYNTNGYGKHDWAVRYCATKSIPRIMHDSQIQNALNNTEKRVITDYWDCGYTGGLTIPLSGKIGGELAGCGISGRYMKLTELDATLHEYGSDLVQCAHVFHSRVLSGMLNSVIQLTEREKECLLWLSKGLHRKEIAHKLNITLRTVNMHLACARDKLNTKTMPSAVCKAVALNIINL